MAFGMREGVDPQLLYEAIRSGAGNSWAFSDRAPRMFGGDGSTHRRHRDDQRGLRADEEEEERPAASHLEAERREAESVAAE